MSEPEEPTAGSEPSDPVEPRPQVTDPVVEPATEPLGLAPRGARPSGLDAAALRPLTVPILVSAVANLVAGYLWFFSACLGIFLTAPMLVLCAFEFIYFARAPLMSARDLDRRGTVIAVFEVILGVFNGVSLVCGILALLRLSKIRDRLASPA